MKEKRGKKLQTKSRVRGFVKGFSITLFSLCALFLLSVAILYAYLSFTVDTRADHERIALLRASRVTELYYDQNENDDVYTPCVWEGEQLSGGEVRIWTPLQEMPDRLWQAFVAIEDKRFFSHDGVDILRTGKAALNYFLGFDRRFGGSTLTQQLIKNAIGDKEQTPMRKLREMYRAVNLERVCTKEEILELYLNAVPLGRNLVGVGAAAERYFGKKVSELTLVECASLAALTNSPTRYDLYRQEAANRARRSLVLRAMQARGYLTEREREEGESGKLSLIAWKNIAEKTNNWYTEQVISDVIDALKKEKKMSGAEASELLYHGGLKIYTCAVPRIQTALESYFGRDGVFRSDIHAAMTVLSSKTGHLLGIVGKEGKKEGNRLLNYANVKRPPGSVIKPLSVYAPALEEGIINYASVVDDVPVSFQETKNGLRPWPYNYPRVYAGLTDIPDAIAYSKNTVAVKIYEKLGKELSYHYLSTKMHVSGIVREGKDKDGRSVTDLAPAPLALGQLTYGTTLLDLCAAYGIFIDGTYRKPISYLEVYDGFGRLLLQNKPHEEKVISEQNAAIMTYLLQSVTDYGTASSITLTDRIACAGKTGTSSFDRDRWFIGYTPEYIGGILCFDEQERAIGYASPSHTQVWDKIMQKLHTEESQTSFPETEGVYRMTYCRDSGGYPCEACRLDARGERIRIGYFTETNMPHFACDRHREFLYDEEGEGIVLDAPFLLGGRRVSLVREEARDFPMQLIVTDAQYTWRHLHGVAPSERENTSYFESVLGEGHYAGISAIKGRPYNALARSHERVPERHFPYFRFGLFGRREKKEESE